MSVNSTSDPTAGGTPDGSDPEPARPPAATTPASSPWDRAAPGTPDGRAPDTARPSAVASPSDSTLDHAVPGTPGGGAPDTARTAAATSPSSSTLDHAGAGTPGGADAETVRPATIATLVAGLPGNDSASARTAAGLDDTRAAGASLWRRVWRPAGQPAWARPALVALLLGTAVLYLWDLGASGWANSFYSAAVQAGSDSWKAFFFGSSDAGNSITVDKTPASLWLMALSVRIFGLNAWAILVPEALAGVAAVGLLYATVRRWFGPAAGLLAGAVMALTPVAVLMFRFNNPDALLVLLLVAAAYATTRAIETASTRWLVLAGALVGFGFLTKMLQALLVLPAFALAYLFAAPTGIGRRIRQVLLAGVAVIGAAGWWVAIVELMPASARPYIGGSQNNSILELALGYNGLGRLTGNEVGSVGGGAAPPGLYLPAGGGPGLTITRNGPGGWGATGLLRMFGDESGGQVSWLLPAALGLFVVMLVLTWRAARTDRTRAAILLWGGWLLTTALTFSLMAGIFHAYYEIALAPAIGATVGVGAVALWRRRDLAGAIILAVSVAGTAGWAYVLLGRSPEWNAWLRPTVLAAGIAAALALILLRLPRLSTMAVRRVATVLALGAGAFAILGAPAAYALNTAATPHRGAIPTAGPASFGPGNGRTFFNMPGPGGGPGGNAAPGAPGAIGGPGMVGPQGRGPGGRQLGFLHGSPGGTVASCAQVPPGGGTNPPATNGTSGTGMPGGGVQSGPTCERMPGQLGGLLDAATPPAEVIAALRADADSYTWVAAAVGSNTAAGYQLGSGEAVMPLGGFNGSDPSPTLAQFQQYVAEGKIHYFIGGGDFMANGGSRASSEISTWVSEHFTSSEVGGTTLYDLTKPTS
jgi:4-amino-4-deoxy-L-arabinose transferase-like glycosyltransferase